jgi:hypothetical protein
MGDARRRRQMGLMPAPTLPFFEDVPAEYRASVSAIPAELALMFHNTINGDQFCPEQVRFDTPFLNAEHQSDIRVAVLYNPPWDHRFDAFLCDCEALSLLPSDSETWQKEFQKANTLRLAGNVVGELMERVEEEALDDESLSEKIWGALEKDDPSISLGDLIKLSEVTP